MFEKTQIKKCYRKVFHHGQSTAKLLFKIFVHVMMIIIKSHSVQINTDPRKTLIWNKTLPWELFEARTATERFFTVDRIHQNTYLVHRLPSPKVSKSILNPERYWCGIKPFYGSSFKCLRKQKSRTAIKRFFTMDKIQQSDLKYLVMSWW